jgi:hypothetical protein
MRAHDALERTGDRRLREALQRIRQPAIQLGSEGFPLCRVNPAGERGRAKGRRPVRRQGCMIGGG